MTREEAAQACPEAVEFLRVMREQFGEVKVLYVAENGHTFGKIPAWRREDEDHGPDRKVHS